MRKRHFRRGAGMLMACMLLIGMLPSAALAAGANALDSTATTADPAGPGYKLTLTGLENGDTAKYYQIIKQDVDTVDDIGNVTKVGTQDWKLTSLVDANEDGIVDGTENTDFGHKTAGPDGKIGTADDVSANGLYVDELVISSFETDDEETKVTSDTRHLTPAMVNAIATAITNNKSAETGSTTADSTGKIEVSTTTAAGMYMFVAVPGANNTKYIYKPIFVSYDYYNTVSTPEDNTHQIAVQTTDGTDVSYADYPATTEGTTDAGVFKKSPLSIDKKSGTYDDDGNPIDLMQDIAVGDTIPFSITVPVPTYSKNYVAPMFYITDTLTEGLRLDPDSIEVVVKDDSGTTIATTKDTDYKVFTKVVSTVTDGFYKFKNAADLEGTTMDGFVVQFLSDNPTTDTRQDGFLYTVTGAPTATITYNATVTETDLQKFAQQVTQMDNTAKLEYSKDPNYIPDGYFKTTTTTDPDTGEEITTTEPDEDFDTSDPDTEDEDGNKEETGELEDKTRHYTFDIDADVLGRDQSGDTTTGSGGTQEPLDESEHDRTSEIRKIFIDSNGKVIQKKTSSLVKKGGDEENGGTTEETGIYDWLEGAEFTLTKIADHVTEGPGTAKFNNLAEADQKQMKFDEDTHILSPDGVNPTSDAKGYIAMKGLDAGIYVLKEIKAPLGYAFNPNVQYQITITPTYVLEPKTPDEGTTPEDGKGGADDLILDSYTVEIVTQELDDNLNIVGTSEVTTISTYNMKKDTDGNPISLLKEDGSSNVDSTADPAGTGGVDVEVTSYGSNETAMIVNKRLGILPATGGSGLYFYLLVGGAIACFFLFLIRKVRKAGEA